MIARECIMCGCDDQDSLEAHHDLHVMVCVDKRACYEDTVTARYLENFPLED